MRAEVMYSSYLRPRLIVIKNTIEDLSSTASYVHSTQHDRVGYIWRRMTFNKRSWNLSRLGYKWSAPCVVESRWFCSSEGDERVVAEVSIMMKETMKRPTLIVILTVSHIELNIHDLPWDGLGSKSSSQVEIKNSFCSRLLLSATVSIRSGAVGATAGAVAYICIWDCCEYLYDWNTCFGFGINLAPYIWSM